MFNVSGFSFKKSFEGTHWEHREHTGYIHTGNTTNSGDHRGGTNILLTVVVGSDVANYCYGV